MPEYTPKLQIPKPLGNETVSRANFNQIYDSIDTNAQKEISKSSTAPSNPVDNDLWIDTSANPNILKRYDFTNTLWINVAPIIASDIGAVENAGDVPSIQEGTDLNKPAAGIPGRMFVARDIHAIYRDTGSGWEKIGVTNWNDLSGKPNTFIPSSHKGTHITGGSDPITPSEIGAAEASHTHSNSTTIAAGFMSASDKSKLDGIDASADVNQNAFSNVKVGTTTISADSWSDTLELVASNGITLTPDATNDKITVAVDMSDTVHGNRGGGSLHSVATTATAGFMSASDKSKLDGVQAGANVNQNAFSNVKVGTTTIVADSWTDTLELAAGSNISLTPDATNDKVTIALTGTVPAAANADTVDNLHAGSFLRSDTSNVNFRTTSGNGNGLRFWDSDSYKIYMSSTADATWGGKKSTNSDYHMYFIMSGGTNRGFAFKNGVNVVAEVAGDGTFRSNRMVLPVGTDMYATQ